MRLLCSFFDSCLSILIYGLDIHLHIALSWIFGATAPSAPLHLSARQCPRWRAYLWMPWANTYEIPLDIHHRPPIAIIQYWVLNWNANLHIEIRWMPGGTAYPPSLYSTAASLLSFTALHLLFIPFLFPTSDCEEVPWMISGIRSTNHDI